jgi:NAD(P)-dependent dehydrogenase (short-subunit alcohol dehydrogenase family)
MRSSGGVQDDRLGKLAPPPKSKHVEADPEWRQRARGATMNDCTRSHVLVTGTSSGIGRATAVHLASSGHHVYAGVRKPDDGAALRRDGDGITPLMLDVTDAEQISAAEETVSAHVGDAGLTGLVNNAAIGLLGPLELMPLEAFRRQMEVNVTGQVAVTQAFLPLLRQARGRIVFMGSIGDRTVLPFLGSLAGSKSALAAIAGALRQELAPWGIRVVLVEPTAIASAAPSKLQRDAEQFLSESSEAGRALYEDAFRRLVTDFTGHLYAGSPPQVVAETVSRALTARRPHARYLVGKESRLQALMATLPAPIGDPLRRRAFHQPAPSRRSGRSRRGSASSRTSTRGGRPPALAATPDSTKDER